MTTAKELQDEIQKVIDEHPGYAYLYYNLLLTKEDGYVETSQPGSLVRAVAAILKVAGYENPSDQQIDELKVVWEILNAVGILVRQVGENGREMKDEFKDHYDSPEAFEAKFKSIAKSIKTGEQVKLTNKDAFGLAMFSCAYSAKSALESVCPINSYHAGFETCLVRIMNASQEIEKENASEVN